MGLGLATIVLGALMPTRGLVGVIGASVVVVVVGLFVYSYIVWRSAPDRQPRGDTT
jgi:membrane-bound ClpP family serine protease